MRTYIVRRVLLFIPVLFGISLAVFALLHMIPGDAVDLMMGVEANPELRAQLLRQYGMDYPWYVQYWNWISGVLRGDFGVSMRTGLPVLPEILSRFKVTLMLTLYSAVVSWLIAIPLGILAAIKRNTWIDGASRFLALLGVSIPNFALGTMVLLVLSLVFCYYPPLDYTPFLASPLGNLESLIWPSLVLGAIMAGSVMRMTRSALLENLQQDYVRTVRAKGAPERVVVLRHALKNSLLPIVTIVGMQIGSLLGGTVVTEQIFSLPGLGLYTLTGITQRDYPVVQGSILFFAFIFVVINLIVDILYSRIDPRISYR